MAVRCRRGNGNCYADMEKFKRSVDFSNPYCVGCSCGNCISRKLGKITREAFGYGDGIVILILGICLGLWDLLIVLMISFLGASLIAILLLVWNKGAKKQSMPFIPFLCIGYVAVILMG